MNRNVQDKHLENLKTSKKRQLLLFAALLAFSVLPTVMFAHGGEDHGEKKPAKATTQNGSVTRSVRLGAFELTLKHALLEPDKAAAGRLFITDFATNAPAGDAKVTAEVESTGGSLTQVPLEKTDAAGSYVFSIPALPEGTYTIRTVVSVAGKTDTATFSGVEVGRRSAESEPSSWSQTAVTSLMVLMGLALFGGLIYFAGRVVKERLPERAVSA